MPKLLLIESDYKFARKLKNELKAEDFIIDISKTGQKGLVKAHPYKYDIIILDLILPGENGLKVCQKLREKEVNAPILAFAGADIPAQKIQAFDSGADDCLVKPFDMEEFLARIRALLRRKKIIASEELKAGDLVVDTLQRDVKKGDKRIYLSTKEYKILVYLLEHRNRIVTRQEVKNYVWGKRAKIKSNTMDVHIRYLRRKLNQDNKKQLIYTIRGEGYRLVG